MIARTKTARHYGRGLATLAFAAALTCVAPVSAAANGNFEGRSYDVFAPPARSQDRPLVIVLHGGKSDGPAMRRYTGFDKVARAFGAVAIYPSAPERAWNDGRTTQISGDAVLARDDAGYLARLARFAAERYGANNERIYAIGISNGGGMAFRLACEHPALLAGIGLVTTKLIDSYICPNGRPLPAILIYGTDDPLSPHGGRTAATAPSKADRFGVMLSADDTVAYWIRRNRCAGRRAPSEIDRVPADETAVLRYGFERCASPLIYFEVVRGGHTWPGAPRRLGRWMLAGFLGETSEEINAGEEAMRFWLRRP